MAAADPSSDPDILHADILAHHDKVLIVDFGSQVTQLIARRVREAGVYCEIAAVPVCGGGARRIKPKAVILSGGPASVLDEGSPRAPAGDLRRRHPGARHLLRRATDGRAARRDGGSRHHGEFGRADVEATADSPLFAGVWAAWQAIPSG